MKCELLRQVELSERSSESIDCIPCSRDVAMTLAIWNVLPLRMRLEMASLLSITSTASTRPGTSLRRSKCWQTTARSVSSDRPRGVPAPSLRSVPLPG